MQMRRSLPDHPHVTARRGGARSARTGHRAAPLFKHVAHPACQCVARVGLGQQLDPGVKAAVVNDGAFGVAGAGFRVLPPSEGPKGGQTVKYAV